MADNTIINLGAGGDIIRDIDKGGKKTQVVALDIGGAGAENLATGFIPTKITNGTTTADVSTSNELLVSFKDMIPAAQSITAQDVASTVTTGSNNQSIITGTPTAGSVATLTISGDTSFSLSVLGTWTGTLQFERSLDAGVTYTPIGAFAAGTSFAPQTTTLNGNFHGNASSATTIRVRSTAAFTGTATIKLLAGAGVGTITVGNGIRLFDKVSGVEHTIKAASTLPLATDTAMVVAVRDAVAVTGTFFQATQPVSASALPLPSGASTETTLSALNTKIPAQGQALAASSTPVVLPAAQITTLTPPAAITGFNLEATQALVKAKTDNLDVLLSTRATEATLTNGTAKTITRTAAKGTTAAADLTSNPIDANTQALHVNLAGTNAVNATLSAETTKIIGVVKVSDGTNTETIKAASTLPLATDTAVVVTQRDALPTGANVIGALSANQTVNSAQIGGVAPLMGNGVTGTGSQRVTIASDNTPFSVNATLPAETTKIIGTVNLGLNNVIGAAASTPVLNIDLLTGNASGWYDASAYRSASIQIVGNAGITTGAITFEQTNDTTNAAAGNAWAVDEVPLLNTSPTITAQTIAASTTRMFAGNITARYVRVRVSTAFAGGTVQAIGVFSQQTLARAGQIVATVGAQANNVGVTANPVLVAGVVNTLGTNFVTTNGNISRQQLTSGGQALTKPYGLPETDWQYAGIAGGIINTTDVVAKAAGAAGIRNYVTGINLQNNSTTVTEFVIKDGATVIWRGLLGSNATASSNITVSFPTPLRGTAATAINIACITTAAAVYANLQGYMAP